MSTVLQIAQDAADEIGLPRPSAMDGSSTDSRQWLALAKREGGALLRATDWSFLRATHTFSTVIGTEDYDFPADFDRWVPATHWDRTQHWRMVGPMTGADDRMMRDGIVNTAGTSVYFRDIGGKMRLYPTPSDVKTLGYEYVSRNWVLDSGGTPKAAISANTDTVRFDEDLFRMGVKWRFLSAKGLDTQTAMAEYQDALMRVIGGDNTGASISTDPYEFIRGRNDVYVTP